MIISLVLLIFTLKSFSNESPYNVEFDANNPPINFLVNQHLRIETGTPQEFVNNIFNNAQITSGYGQSKVTYNLTHSQQQEFIKKYLTKVAVDSAWTQRTRFQKQVKQLAESTYAPDLDYRFIDRVQSLNEEKVKGTDFYQVLLDEGHNYDEIKSLLQKEIRDGTAYSRDGKYDKRDKLLDFALSNSLTDDEFITTQFESMLMTHGAWQGVSTDGDGKTKYSETFKKLAMQYNPRGNSEFGDNLLCNTLAWASYSIRDPASDEFGGGFQTDLTQEQIADSIKMNFKSLSKVIGALSDFGKDTTNGGKNCANGMSSADYLALFSNHPLFDLDDPNLQSWIDKVLKITENSDCDREKLQNVLPEDLCQKDTLISEANEYLKQVKRVGSGVQHIYMHQINNCLIIVLSNLSSDSSKSLSDDDFSMEIKYLNPKGDDTQLDKVENLKNFRNFQMEMNKRQAHALKLLKK